MKKSEELRQERAGLITKMKELNEKAEKENRNLNTEEKSAYEKLKADATALRERYERMEEQDRLERDLNEPRERINPEDSGRIEKPKANSDPHNTEEYKRAFAHYLRTGDRGQIRALEAGVPSEGGSFVPTDTAREVVKALDAATTVREAGARVLATSVDTDIPISGLITGTWEPEEDPYANGADTDPVISVFNAKAHKYTAATKASEELLADSAIDVQRFLTELFVQAWARGADDAYVNGAGAGSNQPAGVLDGGTAKQLATGSTTDFTATQLRDHYYALPQQYRRRPSCAWIVSDAFLSKVAALSANSNNEFLWVPGLREGEADRLMGKPIFVSPAVEAIAASNKVAAFGAFEFYQVVDRLRQFGIKRLNELFAATGQVGFLGSWRTDGKVLVADAFRIMQMSAT